VLTLMLTSGAAAAAPPSIETEAAEVLARLQQWLDGTRDLRGRFVQTLVSGALGTGLEETGRFYVLRPGRMRWDYLEPERKVALVHGDSTRLYLAEDAQLWEGPLEEDALLTTLLTGTEPLAALFEATLVAAPDRRGRGAYRLRLLPRGESDAFREVVLELRPADLALEAADVLDSAGNRMEYRFYELERNTGLTASAFHFEPPAGTEVLRP
jgi:outer membrane lipoprotein carrier protein